MEAVSPDRASPLLRQWLDPAEPRLLAAWHVLMTGNGVVFVDQWPDAQLVLTRSGSNYALLGSPDALSIDSLRRHVAGFLEAPHAFAPVLAKLSSETIEWPRINLLQTVVREPGPANAEVRRLDATDAHLVSGLQTESNWIADTWGGAAGLARSGFAYGAFVDGRLASVACTFFVAERFEDLGVITEPAFRGHGLSPACAAAVCADIRARGRVPSWTTSPDNTASLRVAEKLGFTPGHHDRLWVVGRSVPPAAVYP
jgi:RimJ/RimL family protein N-acetyltransferase